VADNRLIVAIGVDEEVGAVDCGCADREGALPAVAAALGDSLAVEGGFDVKRVLRLTGIERSGRVCVIKPEKMVNDDRLLALGVGQGRDKQKQGDEGGLKRRSSRRAFGWVR